MSHIFGNVNKKTSSNMDCEMNWSVTAKEDSVFINSQNKHDYVRLLMFIIHSNNLQARLVLIPKQINR